MCFWFPGSAWEPPFFEALPRVSRIDEVVRESRGDEAEPRVTVVPGRAWDRDGTPRPLVAALLAHFWSRAELPGVGIDQRLGADFVLRHAAEVELGDGAEHVAID